MQRVPISKLIQKIGRILPAIFLILISLSFITIEVNRGLSHPALVNDWYTHADIYGDDEKLEALEWIKSNTSSNSVFVAEEHFARWLEGYASRRVLMYTAPQYLFLKGEVERSMAAQSILESRFELRNGLVRISDQDPYGNFTPSVSFWRGGKYHPSLYINNLESKFYLTNGTDIWLERLSEANSYKISIENNSYTIHRDCNNYTFEKYVRIEENNSEISLGYNIHTRNSITRILNFTISIYSADEEEFDEVYAESGNMIIVRQGLTWFHISMGEEILKAYLYNSDGKSQIVLSFKPQSDQTRSISAIIKLKPEFPIDNSGEIVNLHRDNIIREYGISYIVIPRATWVQSSGLIPLDSQSLPAYDHLLADPELSVVFENSKIIILAILFMK